MWYHCGSNQNYESFPNFANVSGYTDEELSEEDPSLIVQHLEHVKHSFREYFLIPDGSKKWIRDPFSVSVYELEGLTAAEEDRLVEISTDSPLKLQFKEQSLSHFWAHLQEDYPELSKIV